jgi:hypothetical protein
MRGVATGRIIVARPVIVARLVVVARPFVVARRMFDSAKQTGTRERFRCSNNSEVHAPAICHIPRKHRFSIFSV